MEWKKKLKIVERRMLLVDLENFKGKPVITEEDAITTRQAIEGEFQQSSSDLILIGSSHQNNFVSAKLAWPGAQHCYVPGHNGADIALIKAAEIHLERPSSFNEVILFSGDGIFTRLMKKTRNLGIKGTVVSLVNQINMNLAYASASCMLINPGMQAV